MSGKRFQARAKMVQKLGRDGLVEQNMSTGEEKRVSQRTADISFGPDRSVEQAAGHRAAQRDGDDPATPARKRRKQPRPVQQTAEEAVYAAQAPVSAPEASAPDAPSMRMAADAPMIAPAVTSEDVPPPPPALRKRRRRKNRKKSKRRQVSKHTPDAARSLEDQPIRSAGDAPMQNRPPGFTPAKRPPHLAESGGRLHFEETADGVEPDTEQPEQRKRAVKKRQVMDHAADHAQQMKPSAPAHADGEAADTRQRGSPQPKPKAPELSGVPTDRAAYKKRQAAKLAAHSAAPISSERRRLQFEAPPLTKADSIPDPISVPAPKEEAPLSSRKYDSAVRRVERAEERAEKARADIPTKRRLSFQPEPDGETGRPRRRLHFEQEVLPEYRPPSLPARAGGMAKTAAVMKFHGKIHESERQNVAVEATHKSELFAEQGVGRALRWNNNRRRSRPYRALRQAEQRAVRENVNLAWQSALRDNPELRNKNVLAKWMQKQKIKRKYAQAVHEAKQTAHFTQNVVQATGQIARAVQQYMAARKSLLAVAALLAMVVVFFSAGLTSCTAMLSGFQSSYVSASYMANEQDICNANLYYTELETDLQMDINNKETNYPGWSGGRTVTPGVSGSPTTALLPSASPATMAVFTKRCAISTALRREHIFF